MKELTIHNNVVVLLDDQDYESASQYSWHLSTKGYAIRIATISGRGRSRKRSSVWLHRMILGLTKSDGVLVDHIDGNRLNNQRSNLRICTNAQNLHNVGKSARNTSGYKGVTYKKRDGTWIAQINANGKKFHIGTFSTPEEAYDAYCVKAAELHGDFAPAVVKERSRDIEAAPEGIKKQNGTGFPGITKRGDYDRWEVKIQINGQRKYLGAFDSPEKAHAAYLRAKAGLDLEVANVE